MIPRDSNTNSSDGDPAAAHDYLTLIPDNYERPNHHYSSPGVPDPNDYTRLQTDVNAESSSSGRNTELTGSVPSV